MMNGFSLRSLDKNLGAAHHSPQRTLHSRMLKIANTNDLHFMRECDFRSQSFVDRFTALSYAFVVAQIDRKPREL
jgi:hypothetical protein